MKKMKKQFCPKPRLATPKTTTEFRQLVATMKLLNTMEVLNDMLVTHPQNKGEIQLIMDLLVEEQEKVQKEIEKNSLEVN